MYVDILEHWWTPLSHVLSVQLFFMVEHFIYVKFYICDAQRYECCCWKKLSFSVPWFRCCGGLLLIHLVLTTTLWGWLLPQSPFYGWWNQGSQRVRNLPETYTYQIVALPFDLGSLTVAGWTVEINGNFSLIGNIFNFFSGWILAF